MAAIDALVAALRAQLEAAAEVFRKDHAEGKALAVEAVLNFLRALDLPRAPFFQLRSDLEKTVGKKPAEIARLATAAAAVDVLRGSCGMPRQEAVWVVARRIGMDGATLSNYRRNMLAGRVKGRELYEPFLAAAKAEAKASDLSAEEMKKAVLGFLDDAAALFPSKRK